jgi:RNA polymerase sigma-70 factor, ECF subfamily
MATTAENGLALVDRLVAAGGLREYHLLHATRADFLRRLGRDAEAARAYEAAIARTENEVEREFLRGRRKAS